MIGLEVEFRSSRRSLQLARLSRSAARPGLRAPRRPARGISRTTNCRSARPTAAKPNDYGSSHIREQELGGSVQRESNSADACVASLVSTLRLPGCLSPTPGHIPHYHAPRLIMTVVQTLVDTAQERPLLAVAVVFVLLVAAVSASTAAQEYPSLPWIGRDDTKSFALTRATLSSVSNVKIWLAKGYQQVRLFASRAGARIPADLISWTVLAEGQIIYFPGFVWTP